MTTDIRGEVLRRDIGRQLPVALSHHRQAGGAREAVALAGVKIRWEAGPAAGPPDWSILRAQHQPGARAAFAAFEGRLFDRALTRMRAALPAGISAAVALREVTMVQADELAGRVRGDRVQLERGIIVSAVLGVSARLSSASA